MATLFVMMLMMSLAVEPEGLWVIVTRKTRETVAGSPEARGGSVTARDAVLAPARSTLAVGPALCVHAKARSEVGIFGDVCTAMTDCSGPLRTIRSAPASAVSATGVPVGEEGVVVSGHSLLGVGAEAPEFVSITELPMHLRDLPGHGFS